MTDSAELSAMTMYLYNLSENSDWFIIWIFVQNTLLVILLFMLIHKGS